MAKKAVPGWITQAVVHPIEPIKLVDNNNQEQVITSIEILTKSKERVAQHGEVYTPKNIVSDMLDLVKEESYRIDSKFLEPACGNGNFIVQILERKLKAAENTENYELSLFVAVSNIYAIDILPDNIKEAKERMIEILKFEYLRVRSVQLSKELLRVIEYVIDKNIILGDSLTGKYRNEYGDTPDDIMITEWEIKDANVLMKEYIFRELGKGSILSDVAIKEYEETYFMDVCKAELKLS